MINFKTIKPATLSGIGATTDSRAFDVGQTVYMKLRTEKVPGLITGVVKEINGGIKYLVTWPNLSPEHHFCYGEELTTDFEPNFS